MTSTIEQHRRAIDSFHATQFRPRKLKELKKQTCRLKRNPTKLRNYLLTWMKFISMLTIIILVQANNNASPVSIKGTIRLPQLNRNRNLENLNNETTQVKASHNPNFPRNTLNKIIMHNKLPLIIIANNQVKQASQQNPQNSTGNLVLNNVLKLEPNRCLISILILFLLFFILPGSAQTPAPEKVDQIQSTSKSNTPLIRSN